MAQGREGSCLRPVPAPTDACPAGPQPSGSEQGRPRRTRPRFGAPTPHRISVRSIHLSTVPSRPPRLTASGRAPGGSSHRERASARTHARTPRGRGRGCGGGGGPVPQRPGPADPASENEPRQLPAAPGVGRAPVAGGLQGQRGQGPSVPTPRRGLHAPSPSQRAAASADPGHREEDAARPSVRAAPTVLTPSGRRRSPGSPVRRAPSPLLSRRRLGAPLAPLALFVFVLFYPVTRGRRRGVYWPRGGRPAANRGGLAAADAAKQS